MTELQKKIFVAHNHINDMLLYRGINVEDLKTVSNLELSQMLENTNVLVMNISDNIVLIYFLDKSIDQIKKINFSNMIKDKIDHIIFVYDSNTLKKTKTEMYQKLIQYTTNFKTVLIDP